MSSELPLANIVDRKTPVRRDQVFAQGQNRGSSMPTRFTRLLLATGLAAAALAGLVSDVWAQIPGDTIKIGVLSDFSGPFADQVGKIGRAHV